MNEEVAGQAPGGPGGPDPTEEELRAALEEQMRRIRVEDVLLQTVATLLNVGARRLGLLSASEEEAAVDVDIDQAKLAIDAARALVPLCPQDQIDPIRQALSQLQMAFARETQAGGAPSPGAQSEPSTAPSPGPTEEEERAKARSKIWTPPGA